MYVHVPTLKYSDLDRNAWNGITSYIAWNKEKEVLSSCLPACLHVTFYHP
jgi:hypothetical protein